MCRQTMVTSEDGFLGYVWPVHCRGVTIPPRSKLVVWGRAKAGERGPNCYSVVRQDQVPICLHNLHVSLGCYQKLGKLFQVDETDNHRAYDDVHLKHGDDGAAEVGLISASDEEEEDQTFKILKLAGHPYLNQDEQLQSGDTGSPASPGCHFHTCSCN